jgi:hypothetical protein
MLIGWEIEANGPLPGDVFSPSRQDKTQAAGFYS